MSETYGTLSGGRGQMQTKAGGESIAATVSTYHNTIKVVMYDNETMTIEHRDGTYNNYSRSTYLFDGPISEFLEIVKLGTAALQEKREAEKVAAFEA